MSDVVPPLSRGWRTVPFVPPVPIRTLYLVPRPHVSGSPLQEDPLRHPIRVALRIHGVLDGICVATSESHHDRDAAGLAEGEHHFVALDKAIEGKGEPA